MDKKCKIGLLIGGAVALSVALSNKQCRQKVVEEVKQAKECVCSSVNFIRENREQIFEQIQIAANDVSVVIRDIGEDVKKLKLAATNLKEGSLEVLEATKEAASEIKRLK